MKLTKLIAIIYAALLSVSCADYKIVGSVPTLSVSDHKVAKQGDRPKFHVIVNDTMFVTLVVDNGERCGLCMIYPAQKKELIAHLTKSLEWAKVAKAEKLSAYKPLGVVAIDRADVGQYSGGRQGLDLVFASVDKGETTGVLINMSDYRSDVGNANVLVATEDVPALIKAIGSVEAEQGKIKQDAEQIKGEIQRANDLLK